MLRPVLLVVLISHALSAPQGCSDPCALQESRLPANLDFTKPGNWTEHNEYETNGGQGKVHEEHGQMVNENTRVRYFKKNYTSVSRGGGGQIGDFSRDQLSNHENSFQSRDSLQQSAHDSLQQSLDRTREHINQIRDQSQQSIDHSLQQARDQLEQSRDILSRGNSVQSRGQTENFGSQSHQSIDHSLQQARDQLEQSRDLLSRGNSIQSRGQTENFGVRGLEEGRNSQVGSSQTLTSGSQVREYERHEEHHHEESSSQKQSYTNREVSQQSVRVPHYHYKNENRQIQQTGVRNSNLDLTSQSSNLQQIMLQPSDQFRVGVLELKDDMVECYLDHTTPKPFPINQGKRLKRERPYQNEDDESQEKDSDEEFQQQNQNFDQVRFDQQPARGEFDRTVGPFDSGRNYPDTTTKQPSFVRPNTAAPGRANWFPRYRGTYNTPTEEHVHVAENQHQEKVASTARPFWPIASTARAEVDDIRGIMESLLIPETYDSGEMKKAIGQIMKDLNHTFYSQYESEDQIEMKNSEKKFKFEDQTQDSYPTQIKIAPSGYSGYSQSNVHLNSEHKSQSNYNEQTFESHELQQQVSQHALENPNYIPERPQNFHNYHHNYFQNRYNDHPMAPGFHQIDVYQRPPRIFNPHDQPGIVYAPSPINPMIHPSVKVEQLIPVNKNWESYRLDAFNHYAGIHKEQPLQDQPYQSTQNPLGDHRRVSDSVQKPWAYNQRFEPVGSTGQPEPQLGQGEIDYPDKPYAFGQPQKPLGNQPMCIVYPQVPAGIKTRRRPQMVPCDQLSTTVRPEDYLNPVESTEKFRPEFSYSSQVNFNPGTMSSDNLEKYRGDLTTVEPLGGSTRRPVTFSTTANPVDDDSQQKQQGQDEGDYLQAPRVESQYSQSTLSPNYDQERNQPQWPREIDSSTMRENYHKFMGDLTNSETYRSSTRRPSFSRSDEQKSDQQIRDSEVQVSTDLSLTNRGSYRNQENLRNPQRLLNRSDDRQQNDQQVSDDLVQTRDQVEPQENVQFKRTVVEVPVQNRYSGANLNTAQMSPSTSSSSVSDGGDYWVDNQNSERVIPLQAQPSVDLQAPVEVGTELTTPASPGFWKKLGHKITNTYDKAKEKAKEVFG